MEEYLVVFILFRIFLVIIGFYLFIFMVLRIVFKELCLNFEGNCIENVDCF